MIPKHWLSHVAYGAGRLFLLAWLAWVTANPAFAGSIADVFVDVARIHHDIRSNGDTWDYFWAADDSLYSFGCDGNGYGAPQGMNLNFNRLTGLSWDSLAGRPVNPMTEYGRNGSYLTDDRTRLLGRDWSKIPRGPNWKVTGADSIDGVFYAFVAENWYGNQKAYGGDRMDPAMRQTVNNMSLIKSMDQGQTWKRTMVANAQHPMWTDKRFSTAFFFKYGQNGGSTTQDDQDRYVYAMSNDGYWNSGSHFTLGRVAREKIGDLNSADWEYYCSSGWTHDLDAASRIPGLPDGTNLCTLGSPLWLPSLNTYVAPLWHDVGRMTGWYFPPDVAFEFWQAPHPWGPWSRIGGLSAMDFIGDQGKSRAHRWYGPTLSPKYVTANPDGSVTAILLFSGSTWEGSPDSLYKNNSCPVTFYPQPLPKLRETLNDTAATYSAGWHYETNRNVGDWNNDVHVSTNAGSYCEFSFTGAGVEVLSEKFYDMGKIEVAVDGVTQGRFPLYQDPMPRLYRVPVFRKMDLPPGGHTVRVTNCATNGAFCLVDGLAVFDTP
jgi:hypothetical protein